MVRMVFEGATQSPDSMLNILHGLWVKSNVIRKTNYSGAGKWEGRLGRGTDVILPTIKNIFLNEWTGKGGQLETREVQEDPLLCLQ